MDNILISGCLLGLNCKYDGGNNYDERVNKLKQKYNLIPCCAEIMGGLSTPRDPSEIIGDKVISNKGKDVTKEYKKGAEEVLKLAKFYNVKFAILKQRSPSCGHGVIYDGTFSHTKKEGNGVTADLLLKNGIDVLGEDDIDELVCED